MLQPTQLSISKLVTPGESGYIHKSCQFTPAWTRLPKELLTALDDPDEAALLSLPLDQSFSALSACYLNTDAPIRIVDDRHTAHSDRWLVRAFGLAAREGILLRGVLDELLERMRSAPLGLDSSSDRIEFVWFLFSQKTWLPLQKFVAQIPGEERAHLPLHIADLYFLAFYRTQRKRIADGEEHEAFRKTAGSNLAFLLRSWPDARSRHDAYHAMVDHVAGDIQGARERMASLLAETPYIEPLAALESVLPAIPQTAPDTALDIHAASTASVALLSVDKAYFDRYALLFSRRFATSNPTSGLHFQCVGFDPRPDISKWQLGVSIGVTIDPTDVSRLSIRQQRGYFAAARYRHLADHLDRYPQIMLVDIDGVVERDIRAVADNHRGDDVVITSRVLQTSRRLNRLPWESIGAGACLVKATDGGRNFARAVAAYLAEIHRRAETSGKAFWYGDQNALFYAYYELRDRVRFGAFDDFVFVQKADWRLFEGDRGKLDFMTAGGGL